MVLRFEYCKCDLDYCVIYKCGSWGCWFSKDSSHLRPREGIYSFIKPHCISKSIGELGYTLVYEIGEPMHAFVCNN